MKYLLLTGLLLSAPILVAEPCPDAETTIEINACLADSLQTAEQQMRLYLAEAMERFQDDAQVMEAISDAQHGWQSYRDSHCNSLYQIWRDGTIRSTIYLGCAIDLTEKRSEELRSSYLTMRQSSSRLPAASGESGF